MALSALEKELKLESIIEKEEELKLISYEERWKKELQEAKKQNEDIQMQIEKKRKEGKLYELKFALKKKIEEIKKQAQNQIIKKRSDLKRRLFKIKLDQKRQKDFYSNIILETKKNISIKLIKASKEGNLGLCNPLNKSSNDIINYCKDNFNDSLAKQSDCVKNDNFCYYCCDNEFGEMHLEERALCNSKCEDYINIFNNNIINTSYEKLINKTQDIKLKEEVISNNLSDRNLIKKKDNTNLVIKKNNYNSFIEKKSFSSEDIKKIKMLQNIKKSIVDI